MATFWEIAAPSVDHMFSLYLTICNISYSTFCFEGWSSVLIASVPGLCILLNLNDLRSRSKCFTAESL